MPENRTSVAIAAAASLFLLVILIVAVVSPTDELDGTNWEMRALRIEGSMTPAIEESSVTLSFDAGSVSGFGGCNQYFGDYEEDDGSLSFGPLGSTLVACADPEVSDQEFAFLNNLGSVDGYRFDGDELILTADGTALIELAPTDE